MGTRHMAHCAHGGQRTVGGIMSSFTCGSQGVAAVIRPDDRRFHPQSFLINSLSSQWNECNHCLFSIYLYHCVWRVKMSLKIYLYFMWRMFCWSVCICITCIQCPQWPEEGVEALEAGVTEAYDLPCGSRAPSFAFLQKQQVLLSAGLSLQLPWNVF